MPRALLAAVVLALAGACAPVRAWERGNLTHPCMNPDNGMRTSMSAFHDHTHDVREGFTPCTAAGAGGGCGCN